MSFRSVITLGVWGAILGMGLGCQSSQPTAEDLAFDQALRDRAVPVAVLPSTHQLALGAITGVQARATMAGRRDGILGSDYQPVVQVRRQSVDVRDDQRVINGRVQSNLLWRTRTIDRRR